MKITLWLLVFAYVVELWSRIRGKAPNLSWNAGDDDGPVINPSTGYPMPGDGTGGVDMGGYFYGQLPSDD